MITGNSATMSKSDRKYQRGFDPKEFHPTYLMVKSILIVEHFMDINIS